MSDMLLGAVLTAVVSLITAIIIVQFTEVSALREGRVQMLTATCSARCGGREKAVIDTSNDAWTKWTCVCAAESAVPLK